jgi:hypothetical protein
VTVREGEVVLGDAVAIGGSVTVDGEVRGSVAAIGGNVMLGPHAVVGEDVAAIGGHLTRDPGARVEGKISEVGLGDIFTSRQWSRTWNSDAVFGPSFALMSTIFRLVISCLCCAFVVLLGQPYVDRVGARAFYEPVKSWAMGFLVELLFAPAIVLVCLLLIITIIGIPLLLILIPIIIGVLFIVALFGFASVARVIGQKVGERLHWTETNAYLITFVGVVAIMTPLLLARLLGVAGGPLSPIAFGLMVLGRLVEYLVWTVGLGAVVLSRFSPQTPPAASMVTTGPIVSA